MATDQWERFRANRAALTAARQVRADETDPQQAGPDPDLAAARREAADGYVTAIEDRMPRWQRY